MKSFSEKRGLDPDKLDIQKITISPKLRNSLWNIIYTTYLIEYEDYSYRDNGVHSINPYVFEEIQKGCFKIYGCCRNGRTLPECASLPSYGQINA